MFSTKNSFGKSCSGSSSVQEPVKLMGHVKQGKQKNKEAIKKITKPKHELAKQGRNITGSYTQVSSGLCWETAHT